MGSDGGVVFYGIQMKTNNDFDALLEEENGIALYRPYSGSVNNNNSYIIEKKSKVTQEDLYDKKDYFIIPNTKKTAIDNKIIEFAKKNNIETKGNCNWFFIADELF